MGSVTKTQAFHRFMRWFSRHVGPWLLRLSLWTLRKDFPGLEALEAQRQQGQRFIYAFWHSQLWFFGCMHEQARTCIMISRHRDGEYIARIMEQMGKIPIRGSSTTGGTQAIIEMIELLKREPIDGAITPDGPHGPPHAVKAGAILLAQKTGLPLLSAAVGYDRAWRFKSWDRFIVPKPFARVKLYLGPSFHVPPELSEAEFEGYRLRLQQDLDSLCQRAADEMGIT